ncbi:hypothetical protein EH223_14930 [candidate division KSB1 bacterium]|nr:hypothetical protein [candidate division KSB1 bacterium]RQW01459.1 MAG: hypothetical protein EH223_14930 [candidate division KSB1 bacterium]
MRNFILSVAVAAILCGSVVAHDNHNIKLDGPGLRPKIEVKDDVYIYIKHSDIIIENEDNEEEVTISPQGELFINGDKIRTSRKERDLLIEYNELASAAFKSAKEIGEEGVKIGMKGAELGIKAATGVFKILLPGYTSDDFEKDMEKAAEKVEKKAEKLEEKAEKLEKMLDYLEDIHDDLRDGIHELDDLGWF